MKIRRLQFFDEDEGWVDEAYAYEDAEGKLLFRYNTLTWGRVGAECNVKLAQSKIAIDAIETIIEPDEELRWMAVELIDNDITTKYMTKLDKACGIPQPNRNVQRLAA